MKRAITLALGALVSLALVGCHADVEGKDTAADSHYKKTTTYDNGQTTTTEKKTTTY